jgi:aldose 1-epimerase
VSDERLVLEAGDTRLTVSARDGGRLTSLVTHGHELLVTEGYGPIQWGCYPMAPFAGRIRDGRFAFGGRGVALPRNLPPHAIHGTVFERAWTVTGPDVMEIDLGPHWPFRGRLTQRLRLAPDALDVTLLLEAEESMPAALGFHPWFRRRLVGTAAQPRPASEPVELVVQAGAMYERGADGLPTGRVVQPGPRPWDDCFRDLAEMPRVVWPGLLALEVASQAPSWVVYDGSPDGVCIEPQTAPPDFVHLADPLPAAWLATPDQPLAVTMRWRWSPVSPASDPPTGADRVRAASGA